MSVFWRICVASMCALERSAAGYGDYILIMIVSMVVCVIVATHGCVCRPLVMSKQKQFCIFILLITFLLCLNTIGIQSGWVNYVVVVHGQ